MQSANNWIMVYKKCGGKLCSRNFNTSLRLMENGLNLQSVLNAFVIWNIWWSLTRLTDESFEIILIINDYLENLQRAGSQAICVGATRGSKPDVLCAA